MNFPSTTFVILGQKIVKIWEESVLLENSINFVNFWRNWLIFLLSQNWKKEKSWSVPGIRLKKDPPYKRLEDGL